MQAIKIICWTIWLLLSMVVVFQYVGFSSMCSFFPEGKRWWHFPAQLFSLAFFAAAVLCNPWSVNYV